MVIRKATTEATNTASDLAGMVDCMRSAFEPYRGDYTPEAFADTVPTPEMIHQRLERI